MHRTLCKICGDVSQSRNEYALHKHGHMVGRRCVRSHPANSRVLKNICRWDNYCHYPLRTKFHQEMHMRLHRQYHLLQRFGMDDDLAMEAMDREKRKMEQQYEDHEEEEHSDISTDTDSEVEENPVQNHNIGQNQDEQMVQQHNVDGNVLNNNELDKLNIIDEYI